MLSEVSSEMMVKDRILGGEPHCGDPGFIRDHRGGRLRISVVFTTIEGTLAALNMAARCAKGLCADIAIVVAEVVPFRFPVEMPPVRVRFFEGLCVALIEESKLEKNACNIEVYFCRDQVACLESALKPKSVVVIGAERGWWRRRERGLEEALNRRGFDAIFVCAASSSSESCSQRIAHRLAVEEEARAHLCERSGRLDLH
jgi:hypothetical protein